MKGKIHQEEISILDIYAPNTGASIYIKKKKTLIALKAQIDANTVIVGDWNNPLSPIDRSSRQDGQRKFRDAPHIAPSRHS
jgi:mevalonate kinase